MTRLYLFLTAIFVVLLLLPLFVDNYVLGIFVMIFYWAYVGQTWNVLTGYTGHISLGHALYIGIGAYATTYLALTFELSPWIGMFFGARIAGAGEPLPDRPPPRYRSWLRHHGRATTVTLPLPGDRTFVARHQHPQAGGAVAFLFILVLLAVAVAGAAPGWTHSTCTGSTAGAAAPGGAGRDGVAPGSHQARRPP